LRLAQHTVAWAYRGFAGSTGGVERVDGRRIRRGAPRHLHPANPPGEDGARFRRGRSGYSVVATDEDEMERVNMGIGVSLILIAVGAILTWAVTTTVSGVDLNTVGVILMVVGAVGALISLVFWSSWGGFGGYSRDTIVRDRDRVVER
jgi:hypothetical protein